MFLVLPLLSGLTTAFKNIAALILITFLTQVILIGRHDGMESIR